MFIAEIIIIILLVSMKSLYQNLYRMYLTSHRSMIHSFSNLILHVAGVAIWTGGVNPYGIQGLTLWMEYN